MNHTVFNLFRRTLASAATLALILVFMPFAEAHTGQMHFQSLKQRLLNDPDSNLPRQWIEAVFSNPQLEFEIKGISSYFQHRESTLNYGQFISEKSLDKARQYMQMRMDTLERAQQRFGVDKEVITAVMLVETRLGAYTGYQRVINILSTMAALYDPEIRSSFWGVIPEENRISRDRYEKKAEDKASWAYRELVALLKYASNEKLDPFDLKGSYAGAVGIPQFMPSNILKLAQDGNNDGKIDLFDHEDAIFSIAAYLEYHGWRPEIDRKKAEKVIMHYNRSTYYMKTVLEIADQLKV